MRTAILYMRLMGGTEDGNYRPVDVEVLEGGLYRVLGPAPEDESWQFAPGVTVRAEYQQFTSGGALCAAATSDGVLRE